ncbi:MAG TPA: YbjN domain-containing protein [Blastocatellia bacterium]|nr:YbjN domain-containing protein [Blastocatellia bacterium]
MISTAPLVVALAFAGAMAQDPAPPKTARPAPRLTLIDSVKRYLQHVGATVDQSKSTADMVVSSYADPRGGGKTTIVIVNDRRKALLGFYVYNFGSLKKATNREDVYKFLLGANDAITIGSFFVDNEEDIGYKYMMSTAQPLNQNTFSSIYLTMATVARDRRGEIRQMLGKEREP